jgi:hypothetical protein
MYQEDYFNPADPNDLDNCEFALTNVVKEDTGVNTLTRKVQMQSGKIKNKRIRVYTCGGVGTRIRDAETGEYYSNRVGSKDEDLFYTVSVATGECTSANGYNTLFYCSPQHYENHLYSFVKPESVARWEEKRNARLKFLRKELKPTFNTIVVK